MTDWLKSIQSVGRSFRPGMEVKMLSGVGPGKSVWMDIESDEFKPWRENMRPHYVEMYAMGRTAWFRYDKKPMLAIMYEAIKVVRHNEDSSFEYLKNRSGAGVGILNKTDEKEFVFAILSATQM